MVLEIIDNYLIHVQPIAATPQSKRLRMFEQSEQRNFLKHEKSFQHRAKLMRPCTVITCALVHALEPGSRARPLSKAILDSNLPAHALRLYAATLIIIHVEANV